MVYYRLYRLHGARNEVESFDEFEAPDDASALERSEERRGVGATELWSGHRKVKRWEGVPNAPRVAEAQSSNS